MTWQGKVHKDKPDERIIINYNSDMSGDITIKKVKRVAKGGILLEDGVEEVVQEMEVSGTDILKFVSDYVREEKIRKVEKASWKKILGL